MTNPDVDARSISQSHYYCYNPFTARHTRDDAVPIGQRKFIVTKSDESFVRNFDHCRLRSSCGRWPLTEQDVNQVLYSLCIALYRDRCTDLAEL
ncbi:hypothetical protein J6590_019378 [Homalodisca vitripennis]|nr:hypothetical protein J6590_019378 [Homalodisca vitripennis]